MLKGYRIIVVALVGIALSAASPGADGTVGQQQVSALDRIGNALEAANEPDRETVDCTLGGDARQTELCAQWKAANAAVQAANAADQTVIVGWIGIVLGGLTMCAAIAAAWFAAAAAAHTNIANNITRDSQRAWITLEIEPRLIAPGAGDGLEFVINFIAKNIGQTAATHFDYEIDIIFKGQSEAPDELIARIDGRVKSWIDEHSMPSGSTLIPQATEIDSFRMHKKRHQIHWWHIPQGTPVAQPIFLAAVLYRTMTDPNTVQVSWRTWYLSEKSMSGGPTTFIRQRTPDLTAEKIFIEPFQTTLMHQEHAADEVRSDREG